MIKDVLSSEELIKRAQSNLAIATSFDVNNLKKDICVEDLCFILQRCVIKALKAVLVKYNCEIPDLYYIKLLLKLIQEKTSINIPENVEKSQKMDLYADYDESLAIAKDVLNWAAVLVIAD